MQFSTYRLWSWGTLVSVLMLLLALTWVSGSAFEFDVILFVFAPLGVAGVWISLANTRRAIDDFGGRPMNGILGWLGYDIEPDDEDGDAFDRADSRLEP